MVPRSFQSLRSLRILANTAIACTLATITAGVFGHVMSLGPLRAALGIGVPTVLCGYVWSMVLRLRKTVGKKEKRVGWVASIPLAALNGALACGTVFAIEHPHEPALTERVTKFVIGAIAGGTIGAVAWAPSLVVTLALFGLPLLKSHQLAERGLAGEERGERIVALWSAVLGLVGIALVSTVPPAGSLEHDTLGFVALHALAAVGLASGVLGAVLAYRRERQRRAFVDAVAAGKVQGFRVADEPEGRVLLRVTTFGDAYRVSNFEEAIFAERVPLVSPRTALRAARGMRFATTGHGEHEARAAGGSRSRATSPKGDPDTIRPRCGGGARGSC